MRTVSLGAAICAIAALVPGGAWAASNQEVAQEIAGRLADSGRLSDYDIKIKYEKGTATLRGRVQSKDQMFQAISIAQGVVGVTRVVNEMTVSVVEPAAPVAAEEAAPAPVRPVQFAEMPAVNPAEPTPAPQPMAEPQYAAPVPMARPAGAPVRSARNVTRRQDTIVSESEGAPMPAYGGGGGGAPIPVGGGYCPPGYGGGHGRYDQPNMPAHAWPSYAAYPNYAAVTYPRQYSPTAWPYIGPFYPYPQVPLGWRKVTLEWDDGWWMLDFDD